MMRQMCFFSQIVRLARWLWEGTPSCIASSLYGLVRYLDAEKDARQVSTLKNPSFARGWARLATAQYALAEYDNCVRSWTSAVEALPAADLTPAQAKQKQEYTAGLDKARKTIEKLTKNPIKCRGRTNEEVPGAKAKAMIPDLMAKSAFTNSSAWVIYEATEIFNEGVGHMKMFTKLGRGVRAHPDVRSSRF
ncbi:hypothetical protein K474DRAFT_407293 [Panus rudis PR-1116 ss-1]|nr:hypothetical protein K474DRAFT_407293 [Panus rudis PR-1116 ss-1]